MATSPPGCIARCIEVGATANGEAKESPRIRVPRSASSTPRSTRVRNRTADHAATASAVDTPPYEPLCT
jgi:hypothetical protein